MRHRAPHHQGVQRDRLLHHVKGRLLLRRQGRVRCHQRRRLRARRGGLAALSLLGQGGRLRLRLLRAERLLEEVDVAPALTEHADDLLVCTRTRSRQSLGLDKCCIRKAYKDKQTDPLPTSATSSDLVARLTQKYA